MNRKYTSNEYLEKIVFLRKQIPSVQITSDLMVGFPQESDEDFECTMQMIESAQYSNAFMFVYSRRQGTKADTMEEHISEKVKKQRITKLVNRQNEITAEISKNYLNKIYEVLCEGRVEGDKNNDIYFGRTDCNKMVNFKGSESDIGQFLKIKITRSGAASVEGEKV